MKQLSPAANTVMRLAIVASASCNLAIAATTAGALNEALPAWPTAILVVQIANALIVAGLSITCAHLMGKA